MGQFLPRLEALGGSLGHPLDGGGDLVPLAGGVTFEALALLLEPDDDLVVGSRTGLSRQRGPELVRVQLDSVPLPDRFEIGAPVHDGALGSLRQRLGQTESALEHLVGDVVDVLEVAAIHRPGTNDRHIGGPGRSTPSIGRGELRVEGHQATLGGTLPGSERHADVRRQHVDVLLDDVARVYFVEVEVLARGPSERPVQLVDVSAIELDHPAVQLDGLAGAELAVHRHARWGEQVLHHEASQLHCAGVIAG